MAVEQTPEPRSNEPRQNESRQPKPKPAPDRGFRVGVGEAAAIAAGAGRGSSSSGHSDTYAERIGKSFLDKVLERAADGVFGPGGGGGGGDQVEQLGRMVDVVDKVRGRRGDDDDASTRRGRRVRRRDDDDEDDDDRDRPRRRGSDSSDATIMKVVTLLTDSQKEMFKELKSMIRDRDDDDDERPRRRGRGRDRDDEPSPFEKLAYEALQDKLHNNDPLGTTMGILNAGKQLREAMGVDDRGSGGDDDLDRFIAKERLRLEGKKVDAEIEDMRENRESRSGFVSMLPTLLGRRRQRGGQDPATPQQPGPQTYAYTCDACKHRWQSGQVPVPGGHITCPSCSQELTIGGISESPAEEGVG